MDGWKSSVDKVGIIYDRCSSHNEYNVHVSYFSDALVLWPGGEKCSLIGVGKAIPFDKAISPLPPKNDDPPW